jgi:hypothetical protein
MRATAAVTAVLAIVVITAGPANAVTKKRPPEPVVERSAAGTVIQPTKTIIHDQYGHTTVIVVPRRSYLDPGTEVSPGDRGFMDYMLPPGGNPGRADWTMGGPDLSGNGNYLPFAGPLYIPGYNPYTPF